MSKKKLIKRILFILIFLILIFLFFEIISRLFVGQRLVVDVEENGLYHFRPNQKGWYSHLLRIPNVRINNIGARGKDVDLEKLNDSKNYIFLGDSFTFGWELEDDETISFCFMREMGLDSNSVINYGNGGFGVEHMIESYRFFEELFKKDDVVFMIMIKNDFFRPMIPYEESFSKEFFWNVKGKSSFISFFWASLRHVLGKFELQEGSKENDLVFENFGEKLVEFNSEVEKDKMNLIYVFYEYNSSIFSRNARDFCLNNNLRCITDVPRVIQKVRDEGKEVYAVDKGHPSFYSNQELAKRLVEFVEKGR